jgi:hypothetical protein
MKKIILAFVLMFDAPFLINIFMGMDNLPLDIKLTLI